jgi:hypothetical protein
LVKDRGELYDKIILEGGGRWGFRDNKTPCWHPAIDIDCKLKEGEDASVHQQKLLIRDYVLADNCEIVHRVFDWYFPDAELHVIVDLKENLLGAHIIALGINISDGNVGTPFLPALVNTLNNVRVCSSSLWIPSLALIRWCLCVLSLRQAGGFRGSLQGLPPPGPWHRHRNPTVWRKHTCVRGQNAPRCPLSHGR